MKVSTALHQRTVLIVKLSAAHHVRNRSSQVFSSVCKLKAQYRWCLTGTPVHNSLDDYGALLSFIRVYPFRAKSQFNTHIAKPVEEKDESGVQRLQELVRATCLRRTKQQALASGLLSLPHRTERTCQVHLLPDDQALYGAVTKFLQKIAAGSDKQRKDVSAKAKGENVMALLNYLRLICNHGEELVPHLPKVFMDKGPASCIDQVQGEIHANACSSCGGETDGSSAFTGPHGFLCIDCAHLETKPSDPQLRRQVEQKEGKSASESTSFGKSMSDKCVRPSAKVVALLNNLRHEASISGCTRKSRKR